MTIFTDKEISVFKLWLLNKKNKEIAEELQVSEADVSQTLSKIEGKIGTLEKSVNLLKEMGIIEPVTPLKITEEGKKSFLKRRSSFSKKFVETKPPVIEASYLPHIGMPDITDLLGLPRRTFTISELQNTITEIVQFLVNPDRMESPSQLADRLNIPIDIVMKAHNVYFENVIDRSHPRAFGYIPPNFRKVLMRGNNLLIGSASDIVGLNIDPNTPAHLIAEGASKWEGESDPASTLRGDIFVYTSHDSIQLKPTGKYEHKKLRTAANDIDWNE